MGRVLVKSALPGKVLVKSNYAFDAFGNPVLLSTPSTSKGAPVRGERLAGVLGGAAGAGLALTQPANSLAQLINNLRYGMFEGARDARGLRRGLAGRREKIRANRAADIADKYAAMRTQEPLDQRRQRGLFDRLTGGNLRTTANQERELYEADEQRRLADERAARNAALGQEVFNIAGGMRGERPEDLNLEQGQEALRNIRQLGVAGAQLGDRIDARESVPLPDFANQNPDLIADINQEIQTRDVMPQEEDVNVIKPGAVSNPFRNINASIVGGRVLVNGQQIQPDEQGNYIAPGVNITDSIIGGKGSQDAARRAMGEALAAGGSNADAKAAMHEAIMQSMNQPPESVEQPIVNVAGKKIGVVGSPESMARISTIQPPADEMGAANAKEQEIPPTTTVNPAMDRFNQMKPEPDEEEEEEPSMLSNIQEKMRGFRPEVEA